MSWDVIRGCGKIFKHGGLYEDGKGLRTTKSMLEEFVVQFAKRTKKYFDATGGDLPYIYRERQLSSIVLLALDEVCDVVSAEAPTIRNTEEGKYGWVDYWALKGKSTILIELKHAYEAFISSTDVKTETVSRFRTAISQIRSINVDDFRNGTSLVGLALMIVTAYTQTKKDISVSEEIAQQNLKSIIYGLQNEKQQVTFAATWYVPEEMCGKLPYANGRKEFYPFIHFIALAEELDKTQNV